MKKLVFSFATLFISCTILFSTSCTAQAPKVSLKTEIDSLSYAMGVNYTQGIEQLFTQMEIPEENYADFVLGVLEVSNSNVNNTKTKARLLGMQIASQTSIQWMPQFTSHVFGSDSTKSLNKDDFYAGFIASITKKDLKIDPAIAEQLSNTIMENIQNQTKEKAKAENVEWLEKNKSNDGVVVLPSGLQYKILSEGTGEKPAATDTVVVHYTGKNIHGEQFDSTADRDPAEFPLNGVIAGWTEGIQLMSPGAKYMLYVPYDLAYGEQARSAEIGPFSTLIFEVELLEVKK